MNAKLRALIARRDKALEASRAITRGMDDGQNLTAQQSADVDRHLDEARLLNEQIAAERDLEASAVPVDPGSDPGYGGGSGFNDFTDYLKAVVKAGNPHLKAVDQRLLIGAGPTTYGNEASGEDGGYLVPQQTSQEIFQHALSEDALLPLTQSVPVGGNSMSFPVSETMPWGSSGVLAFWEGEAAQLSQSKPAFEERELRLRKLTCLVPVTNELLEDARALASWLPEKLAEAARWKTNDAIVNGSGTGMPHGFAQSGAIITQGAESGQSADTVVSQNVAKMYSRCTNPARSIWLINPDAFNQVVLLTIGDSPVWVPTTGLRESPNGRLLGRPIILTDACQTLGDAGDIYFADLKSYQTIQKQQGPKIATSMHLYFDYDMTAFRLTFRIDGQSLSRNPITPPNSNVTRSPFVRLEART